MLDIVTFKLPRGVTTTEIKDWSVDSTTIDEFPCESV